MKIEGKSIPGRNKSKIEGPEAGANLQTWREVRSVQDLVGHKGEGILFQQGAVGGSKEEEWYGLDFSV